MNEFIDFVYFIFGTTVGGVLGYLFKTQIDHRLGIVRINEAARLSNLHKAKGEFWAGFAPAIAKFPLLRDSEAIDAMLKEELIPQAVAIEKFRPFIVSSKKNAYQEAWENYHQSHKREGVSSVYFLDYAIGDENERFSLFNSRINKILKFADE